MQAQAEPKKCHLFKKEVVYLFHEVRSAGISTDPDKIAVTQNWFIPTDVGDVCSGYPDQKE